MPTGEGRHEACPYVVIESRKVGSGKRVKMGSSLATCHSSLPFSIRLEN